MIVGAGFSGIGAAIDLDRAGFSDYLIVERATASAAPGTGTAIRASPSTSRRSATSSPSSPRATGRASTRPGEELRGYAERCADRYGLRDRRPLRDRGSTAPPSTRTSTCGGSRPSAGDELVARHLIDATGVLTQPKRPEIEGVDSFEGVTLHTARWDPDVELRRQARRRDRHRRLGGAADPGDRRRGRAADRLPAHADLVPAQARRRRSRAGCARCCAASRAAPAPARLLSQAFVELNFPLAAHFHSRLKLGTRIEGQAAGR